MNEIERNEYIVCTTVQVNITMSPTFYSPDKADMLQQKLVDRSFSANVHVLADDLEQMQGGMNSCAAVARQVADQAVIEACKLALVTMQPDVLARQARREREASQAFEEVCKVAPKQDVIETEF